MQFSPTLLMLIRGCGLFCKTAMVCTDQYPTPTTQPYTYNAPPRPTLRIPLYSKRFFVYPGRAGEAPPERAVRSGALPESTVRFCC